MISAPEAITTGSGKLVQAGAAQHTKLHLPCFDQRQRHGILPAAQEALGAVNRVAGPKAGAWLSLPAVDPGTNGFRGGFRNQPGDI